MAAEILRFPNGRAGNGRRRVARGHDLGPTLETALRVHNLIVQGLRLRRFVRNRQGLAAALLRELNELYGEDAMPLAVDDFSIVYGCDPFAFLEHLAECR
ncbi:MAG: hypothetical protein MUE49_06205 [Rhodospirillales bacterium]|nr:hypothetical protein [Rhodospirillales bacterium]